MHLKCLGIKCRTIFNSVLRNNMESCAFHLPRIGIVARSFGNKFSGCKNGADYLERPGNY
jgi:hypothetical protein